MEMELLTGEYRNTLDEKGRILFPTKLRSALQENTLVITQSLDHCLWLYKVEDWNTFSSKFTENASPFDKANRFVMRRLIGPAQSVEFDKAGRISIPQTLREYAGLTKDCVIVAVDRYIELWDAAEYAKNLAENEESLSEAEMGLTNIKF